MHNAFVFIYRKFLDHRAVAGAALGTLRGSDFGKENAQTGNVFGGKFIFKQVSMRCLFIFSHCGPRCSIGRGLNFVCAGLIIVFKLNKRIAHRHRLFKCQRERFRIVLRNDAFGMPYRLKTSIDRIVCG